MLINIALFIYQFNLFQSYDRFYYMRIRTRVSLWLLWFQSVGLHFYERFGLTENVSFSGILSMDDFFLNVGFSHKEHTIALGER